MSFGSFILGMLMMIAGVAMVARTNWFLYTLGDISDLFGMWNASWMSWKLFGIILTILGFLLAFGLFQLFFTLTLGRLFLLGG